MKLKIVSKTDSGQPHAKPEKETTPEQLDLNLLPPKIVWLVQVSRTPSAKSGYKNRFVTDKAAQAIGLFHGINVGRGYKKRLMKLENGKRAVIARVTS